MGKPNAEVFFQLVERDGAILSVKAEVTHVRRCSEDIHEALGASHFVSDQSHFRRVDERQPHFMLVGE